MNKILIIVFSILTSVASAQEIGLKIGDIAPELAYNNPTGNKMKLSSLKGKLVLIDFWASCIRAEKYLNWQSSTNIEEGIKKTWLWLINQ